jgi:1,4-alpha-glucan branching enzyme
MMYKHHGMGTGFSGGYHEYFGDHVDVEGVVYLILVRVDLESLCGGFPSMPMSVLTRCLCGHLIGE